VFVVWVRVFHGQAAPCTYAQLDVAAQSPALTARSA